MTPVYSDVSGCGVFLPWLIVGAIVALIIVFA